ncbi:uncharacterized protein LOC130810821 [Amaranthus tricolor]|uniref:uncharacterized protein LOC130810821 n=1 Tax=Amaranthus tricolor TaxID=29722 RepID=UPI00258B8234|nr:uncharacterized protein LOC130810821 [Amaranthus tricolor]
MRVQRLEAAFMNAQHSMPQDPHNVAYASQECELATALQQAQIDHTSLLQQRAKMSWLRFGDDNTSFFHRSIKQRRLTYQSLGTAMYSIKLKGICSLSFTAQETKDSLWSIPNDKVPGLDGNDVVRNYQEFFTNGKLLKAWNVDAIILIPKTACRSRPGKNSLLHMCFINDIVKYYSRKHCLPSALLKIDPHKAYDMMEWQFIKDMLVALRFPSCFIWIVIACISSTSYSLLINGSPLEAFDAQRGLDQGDLMSPLLLVLGMEYL